VRQDAKKLRVTSSGDYNAQQAAALVDTRTITGDVVGTYLHHTGGTKQGITFAASIEHAQHLADAYNAAGVGAACISSKTKPGERKRLVKQFRAGQIMQLVNVDLFGEGFDVPAIYCVSFVRPTLSYSLYMQQFGRALRNLPGKEFAWIFDHVANVYEHRLPDHGRPWTLDAPLKRSKRVESDYELVTCRNPECCSVFQLPAATCPWCGESTSAPSNGNDREYKVEDGELVELTLEELQQLRGKRNQHDRDPKDVLNGMLASGSSRVVAHSVANNHAKRQHAQAELRTALHRWWVSTGLDVPTARVQFARIFNVDVHTALVLNTADSVKLTERVLTTC
jgi:superfamily II DNA or RNA helicase